MAGDRSVNGAGAGAAPGAGAGRTAAPSGGAAHSRVTPSWASGPAPVPGSGPASTLAPAPAPPVCPAPDAGLAAAPAAGPALPQHPGAPDGTTGRSRWWREVLPALRDRLPLWLQPRCGLEPRALAALAVVLVGASVFAAAHFWSARPEPVHAPDRLTEAAAVQAGGPAGGSGSPGAQQQPDMTPGPAAGSRAGVAPGGQIVVDVSGKVRRPGIQHLPAGSRVADALRAAGGVREGADVSMLNRARVLTDGEQVAVGLPGAPPPGGGTAADGGPGAGQAGPMAPLSLGTATVEQLETLPGVGPVLAQHIIEYRTEHGGYRSVDELREVDGIGDRRFADLRPLVRP
ncbi:ComEA family DNA-binding protein [Streptomyces sp. NBC_01185]|nr:ComEA family DNA-binding protein [Streptomyces sp. NBC_01185]